MAKKNSGIKLIANNKKAYYDYFIEDTYEAGIVLHGTEVKSLRMGRCSVKSHLSGRKTESCLFIRCTSAPMKREIYLIRIRCVQENFCFTEMRFIK